MSGGGNVRGEMPRGGKSCHRLDIRWKTSACRQGVDKMADNIISGGQGRRENG